MKKYSTEKKKCNDAYDVNLTNEKEESDSGQEVI